MDKEFIASIIGGRGGNGSTGAKPDRLQPFSSMTELIDHFKRQGTSLNSQEVTAAAALAAKDKNFKPNQ